VPIHFSKKQKFFIPIAILAAILIFLGSIILYNSYDKIHLLQQLNEKITFSTKIATAVHNLQKERGLSCGYILDRNSTFNKKLSRQKEETDKILSDLKHFISEDHDIPESEKKYLLATIAPLTSIRTLVQGKDLTYNEIIYSYTFITESFLQMIAQLATTSHIPKITSEILAYSSLLYMKEYRGTERALGVTILSKHEKDIRANLLFNTVLAMEKEKEKTFFTYASPAILKLYSAQTQTSCFYQVDSMRNDILFHDKGKDETGAVVWFDTITKTLNALTLVGDTIQKEIQKHIETSLYDIRRIFVTVNLLTVSSLLIFVLMIISLAKLLEDERRLRLVSDKYIISSVTDLKGKIIDVSQAFCDITGYTKEELVGKNHNIVRHPDMPKEVFRDLWYKISNGHSWSGKVKNLKKDGGYYWVYAHIEPLYNTAGNIDSYISIRLDITESEELQEKVREEEEKNRTTRELMQQQSRLAQMGEMISMIAHQWRQPLTAITATTTTLHFKARHGNLEQENVITLANRINELAQHLSATINDFRNFFKTNNHKQQTDFDRILQSVLNIINSTLAGNHILLNIVQKGELSTLFTYENELKQVILNLIKNAEDALLEKSVPDPKITIEIDGNTFIVKDNAGGIPEDILPRIFDPYFSTKVKKDGTGLGLYMSKIIVEEHCKGKLLVENDVEGAVFTIVLD
jgi:PAS domain S-box-containing protein